MWWSIRLRQGARPEFLERAGGPRAGAPHEVDRKGDLSRPSARSSRHSTPVSRPTHPKEWRSDGGTPTRVNDGRASGRDPLGQGDNTATRCVVRWWNARCSGAPANGKVYKISDDVLGWVRHPKERLRKGAAPIGGRRRTRRKGAQRLGRYAARPFSRSFRGRSKCDAGRHHTSWFRTFFSRRAAASSSVSVGPPGFEHPLM